MKYSIHFGTGIVVSSFLFLFTSSIGYAEIMNSQFSFYQTSDFFSRINNSTYQENINIFNKEISLWYPGFLIIQLIRGIVALILVLLILFDIIEPS